MANKRAHRTSVPRDLPAQGRRLAVLDVDECLDRLARHHLGRLAFIIEDEPVILPLNYLLHQGSVVVRTGTGTILDEIIGAAVAFEVDDVDAAYEDGWSVVVHGRAEEVDDPEQLATLRELPLQPWAPGDRARFVRITPSAMTGRRIT